MRCIWISSDLAKVIPIPVVDVVAAVVDYSRLFFGGGGLGSLFTLDINLIALVIILMSCVSMQ